MIRGLLVECTNILARKNVCGNMLPRSSNEVIILPFVNLKFTRNFAKSNSNPPEDEVRKRKIIEAEVSQLIFSFLLIRN